MELHLSGTWTRVVKKCGFYILGLRLMLLQHPISFYLIWLRIRQTVSNLEWKVFIPQSDLNLLRLYCNQNWEWGFRAKQRLTKHDNLVLSTGLVMWIDPRKEIRKHGGQFAVVEPVDETKLIKYSQPTQHHSFFRNLPSLFIYVACRV